MNALTVDPRPFRRGLQLAAVLVCLFAAAASAQGPGPDLALFGTDTHATFRSADAPDLFLFGRPTTFQARPPQRNQADEVTAPNPSPPAEPPVRRMVVYYWTADGDWCKPCKLWEKDRPDLEGIIRFVDGSKAFPQYKPKAWPTFAWHKSATAWHVVGGYKGALSFRQEVIETHRDGATFRAEVAEVPAPYVRTSPRTN